MSQGIWVLVAALVLATAFGVYRLARDGRFRGTRTLTPSASGEPGRPDQSDSSLPQNLLAHLKGDLVLGERATLLQFSSAFCAPCRVTRRVLADVAQVVPGVAHVEVDAEGHLDLVRL
ncbi:MAG: thioredoxin family protein, partial [Nocardioidaceae bacterium]